MVRLGLGAIQGSDISPLANLTGLTHLTPEWNRISDISALANLTNLTELELTGNKIGDISALSTLTNLSRLKLYSNQIKDILPLVRNTGIDAGDSVYLDNNPLSPTSLNEYIPQLKQRGVEVTSW